MGEFMKYLPITLIIVLTSSLFVALVIIPVISATFIKTGDGAVKSEKEAKRGKRNALIVAAEWLALEDYYFLLVPECSLTCLFFLA